MKDVNDFERTVNYIKFQLAQNAEVIEEHQLAGLPHSTYSHNLGWDRSLRNELNDMFDKSKQRKPRR